jgi:hypothetical protein
LPIWAAAGFLDTLLRWDGKPEVADGEAQDLYAGVQAGGGEAGAGARGVELIEQLAELEDRLLKMRLPNAYAAMGYMLKLHVKNLREAHAGHAAAS